MSNGSKLLIVLTVIVSLCYYTLFYSSLPIKVVTGLTGLSGLEFEDVDGSLESGVQIGSIKTKDGQFIVRNFRFNFNGLLGVWRTQELKITEFNIDEFLYVQAPTKSKTEKSPDSADKKLDNDKKDAANKPEWLKTFSIDVLKIAKVYIKLNAFEQPFIVDEFKLSGFHSNNPQLFKTLVFTSNHGSLSMEPDQKGRGFKLSFKALPSIFKVLKQELSVDGELMIESGRLTSVHLNGFDGKFQANLKQDDLVIVLNDLDLSQYFKQDYAISKFNGEIFWSDFQHLSFENVATKNLSFSVGLTKFGFEDKKLFEIDKMKPDAELNFRALHSPELFINFSLDANYSSKTDSDKKLLKATLVSIPLEDKLTLLTKVYFQTSPELLSVEQTATLERVAKFFE